MKHFMTSALLLLVPSIVLASGTVDLYIRNYSATETLVIKKGNGEEISVPPEGYIDHVSFATNSEPSAYVSDKYVCTWVGIKYWENLEPVGLNYASPYPHSFKCETIYSLH